MESAMAVGFRSRWWSSCLWSNNKLPSRHSVVPRRNDRSFYNHCNSNGCSPSTVRVCMGPDYADSDCGEKPLYHPFEEIKDSDTGKEGEESGAGGPARMTDAELTRTLVEVHSKATLMLSGVIGYEVHENIFCPAMPYVTDENGDIYFEVPNDEDILQTLTAENNFVQVIIGLDNLEMLPEMELLMPPDIDFGIEEIMDEDSDGEDEDDYDKDWVSIIEDKENDFESSEELDNWTSFDTMRSCHPMYFANRITEVVSNLHLDWMGQPATGIAIQGLLRPAFVGEKTIIQRHITGDHSSGDDPNGNKHGSTLQTSSKDRQVWEDEPEKQESLQAETSFYKLEMMNIQLVSAYGSQTSVEVEDFRQAQPDMVAQSAAKILSHFKAGGMETILAIKSLCWKCKGIRVEEAAIIGVDSLGFDVRVCVGAQVETLRFAFSVRATSAFDAERELQDLLFPRVAEELPTRKEQQGR